jgi:hypothetical protein
VAVVGKPSASTAESSFELTPSPTRSDGSPPESSDLSEQPESANSARRAAATRGISRGTTRKIPMPGAAAVGVGYD